jgi:hypothetical protein
MFIAELIRRLFGRTDYQIIDPVMPAEALVEGLEDLNKASKALIRSFVKRVEHLEREVNQKFKIIEKLEDEVRICDEHREQLQSRVELLEEQQKQESTYAHDRVHEFENFMEFLEMDLKAAGIEPVMLAGVLTRVRQRQLNKLSNSNKSKQ